MEGKKQFYILFALLIVMAFGCEEDNPEIDPAKAILGKWEIIEYGNGNDMQACEAHGYNEYLADSVLRYFNYEEQKFTSYKKYWMDSLLYNSQFIDVDVEIINTYDYFFKESDNLLVLEFRGNKLYNKTIHKKIH